MSLPSSWNTVRVFATFKNFDTGEPAEGSVTFDPLQVVTLPEGDGRTIIMPTLRTILLDSEGKIDIALPATDDTDLNITGMIYRVIERIAPANRTYFIEASLSGGDIDLATVSPLVDPPNLVSTRGQSAYDLWLADGHSGTLTDFLDWLGAIPGPPGPEGPTSTVQTEATAARIYSDSDAGKYTRHTATGAKTATFNTAATLPVSSEFHVTNRAASGNLTLNGTMTLHPQKNGTLVLAPGDTVTVKVVSETDADVIGSTVPA